MPTIKVWRGDAQADYQAYKVTCANVQVGDIFRLTINLKDVEVTADAVGGTTQVQLVARVLTLLGAYMGPQVDGTEAEFQELQTSTFLYEDDANPTAVTALIVRGPTDGTPFTLTGSASEGGIALEIDAVQDGDPGQNEKQRVTIAGPVTGGTFTLDYDGQVTAAIAYNASAYTVRDALCALSNIAGTDEVQRLTSTATGGTFTITFEGQTTSAIAFNASAATIQGALEALSNVAVGDVVCAGGPLNVGFVSITFAAALGRSNRTQVTVDNTNATGGTVVPSTTTAGVNSEVTVTGSAGGPWDVEFVEGLAGTDATLLVGNGGSLTKAAAGYGVSVTTLVQGDAGKNEKQFVRFLGTPTGGTYTLNFNGQVTGAIAYNAAAATVQTSLEGLSNIAAGEAVVTGAYTTGFTVEFKLTLGNTDVAQLVVDGTNLTGGQTINVVETTKGAPSVNTIIEWAGKNSVTLVVPGFGSYFATWSSTATADQVISALSGSGSPFLATDFVVSVDGTTYRIEFVGRLAGIDIEPTDFGTFDNRWQGMDANAEKIQAGDDTATDEVQTVTLLGEPLSGNFTLSFNGQTTANIAYNASASTVQAAFVLLSTVGSGNCTVAGNAGGPYTFTFAGTLAGTDVPAIIGNVGTLAGMGGQVTTTQAATQAFNEKQVLTLTGNPSGGTFTLSFEGDTTGNIAYNASAAAVQTELDTIATLGSGQTSVTGEAGGPWQVEFTGTRQRENVPAITGSGALLSGAAVLVNVTQEAVPAINEQQQVTVVAATAGTFTLTYGGQTTAGIPYDAAPGVVEAALQAISSITAGGATVSGSAGGPWLVEFTGTLAGSDLALMTGSAAGLSGGGTQTLTVADYQEPTGPNWFPEGENWNPATPPANDDILVWEDNDVDTKWGLEDLPSITPYAIVVRNSYTGQIGLKPFDTYWEYRPSSLKTACTRYLIGEGEGSGSGLLRFNCNSAHVNVQVFNTANASSGQACIFKNSGANSDFYINRGSVGIGTERRGDVAAVRVLAINYVDSVDSDAIVSVGNGVTALTTLNQAGGRGDIDLASGVTIGTIKKTGGALTVRGECGATTIDVQEGTLNWSATGTVAAAKVGNAGTVLLSGDLRAKTFTAVTLTSGATWLDPFGVGTYTNGVVLYGCSLQEVTVDFGTHRTVAISAGP